MMVVVDLSERDSKQGCSGCENSVHRLIDTLVPGADNIRASVADYGAQSVGLIRYFSPVARLLYACAASSVATSRNEISFV